MCVCAKITQYSFPDVRDRMKGLRPVNVVSADILIMLNISSREGYRYIICSSHYRSCHYKQSWVYPLKPRESKELLVALKQFVEDDLPKLINIVTFWLDALRTSVYIINWMPTKTASGFMTPYESYYCQDPSLKWLKIWGCKAYALKPISERRKNFDDKAYSGFLVGYIYMLTRVLVTKYSCLN